MKDAKRVHSGLAMRLVGTLLIRRLTCRRLLGCYQHPVGPDSTTRLSARLDCSGSSDAITLPPSCALSDSPDRATRTGVQCLTAFADGGSRNRSPG